MNTVKTLQMHSHSLEATEILAEAMGGKLRGSEVIVLSSDLGGGKTAFVRGLARGMGSMDRVSSPTFTISREYYAAAKQLTLYHFDFYRLAEPGLMSLELAEVIDDPHAVVAVEWADIVDGVLPADTIKIMITSNGESDRTFHVEYPADKDYLFEDTDS